MEGTFEVGGVGEGVGRVGVGGWAGCGTGSDEGEVGVREERAGGVRAERDRADEEEGAEDTGPGWGRGWAVDSGEETGPTGGASEEGRREHPLVGVELADCRYGPELDYVRTISRPDPSGV